MRQVTWAFISGLLFALGLGLSGMTRPSKVIGFLDLSGVWDPSLLFVMIGAIAVYAVAFRLVMRRRTPLSAAAFHVPPKRALDARLAIGAVLFGTGWGLGGYCPGPGLVGAATGNITPLTFVASMVAGIFAYSIFQRWQTRASSRSNGSNNAGAEGSRAN